MSGKVNISLSFKIFGVNISCIKLKILLNSQGGKKNMTTLNEGSLIIFCEGEKQ